MWRWQHIEPLDKLGVFVDKNRINLREKRRPAFGLGPHLLPHPGPALSAACPMSRSLLPFLWLFSRPELAPAACLPCLGHFHMFAAPPSPHSAQRQVFLCRQFLALATGRWIVHETSVVCVEVWHRLLISVLAHVSFKWVAFPIETSPF